MRDGIEAVTGPADPLHQTRDLPGGAKLDDVLDMPDIDPEFHRRRRDERPDLALPEPLLGLNPDVTRERAVVDLDVPTGVEFVPESLGGHPGVDEDEGGAGQIKALPDGPRLSGEVLPGKPDVDIETACDRHFDKRERPGPAEEPADLVRVSDGRREADPLELPRVGGQTLERHRELGAPLAVGKLVDLIDDDVPDVLQMLPKAPAHEERLQGLRGGDKEVGRGERLLPPLVLRRIPVPDADREPELPAPPHHPREDIPV